MSRVLARALIALLHVLQPFARARGRLRGMLTSPESRLAGDPAVLPSAADQIGEVFSFLTSRGRALCFWSESWVARETMLMRMVESLRSTRVATALEVDDGWHGNKDVSLQLGRWARLDVQLLAEEHEQGRVLIRIARRLRLSPFFVAFLVSLTLFGAGMMRAPSAGWLTAAPVLLMAAGLAHALWLAATMSALADRVMTKVLIAGGAVPLNEAAAHVAARVVAASRATSVTRMPLGLLERSPHLAASPWLRQMGPVNHDAG